MCLDQALEEALGCSTVPLRLKIHVNHFAILVDGPPEIVLLAVDFHENFVDEESVTIAWVLPFQSPGVLGTEFDTPQPIGFAADSDAAFS
jgi:hypothetical protein